MKSVRDLVPAAVKGPLAAGGESVVLAIRRMRWRGPVTRPHYFDFGDDRDLVGDDLVRPEAWDALRVGGSSAFALPATREEWERGVDEQVEIADRARAIERWLPEGISSLASYGVGAAVLECWLNRLQPERRLLLGEYAPETVRRLSGVFSEAEVHRHDLLRDPPLDADLHLFHRIDTEFSHSNWRRILDGFRSQRVLFVASDLLTLERDAVEVQARERGGTWAGYLRNRPAFERLWRRTHRATALSFGELAAWHLEPRGTSPIASLIGRRA